MIIVLGFLGRYEFSSAPRLSIENVENEGGKVVAGSPEIQKRRSKRSKNS